MKRLTTALLALALLGGTPALAHDTSYTNDRDQYQQNYNRDNYNRDNYRSGYHRSYSGHHRWHRGDRLNRAWWLYMPVNWRHHHFRAPPYGYHWIYVDGYFLLVDRRGFVIEVVFA